MLRRHKAMELRVMRQNLKPLAALAVIALALVFLAAPARANTIAGGYGHSLGVKTDGTVVAWGYNQLWPVQRPGRPQRRGGRGRGALPQPGPEGRRHRGGLGR